MNRIRTKARWALQPPTVQGLMQIQINGCSILDFLPERFSRIYLSQGYLRCDSIQPSGNDDTNTTNYVLLWWGNLVVIIESLHEG